MTGSGKVVGKHRNVGVAYAAAGALITLLVIYLGVLSFPLSQPNQPAFVSAQPG